MRIAPGDLRSGLLNSSYRIPVTRPTIVTPHAVISKALRVFHTDGDQEALDYLDQAFSKVTWRSGGNATKARNARASFENYRRRAAADVRVASLGDQRATVALGQHHVAAGCDVVLLDDQGYEGRICLWGIQERAYTQKELSLLACPIVMALGDELGDDQINGVEFWFLRGDTVGYATAEQARGRAADLRLLVNRIAR